MKNSKNPSTTQVHPRATHTRRHGLRAVILAVVLGVTLAPPLAIAQACTSQLVYMPGGQTMLCTTCCTAQGFCTTNCV